MSIIIIVSVAAALLNDTIRTEGTLVAVDTGFEDEIRGELDGPLVIVDTGFEDEIRAELEYVTLTTSFINQKETGKEIN